MQKREYRMQETERRCWREEDGEIGGERFELKVFGLERGDILVAGQ